MLSLERAASRIFILKDDGGEVGRHIYPKWWSSNAELHLAEGVFTTTGKGMLQTGLLVKFQDIPILDIRYSAKGDIVIQPISSPAGTLRVKTISHWHSRYQVIDASDRIRLTARMKAKWPYLDRDHMIDEVSGPHLSPLELLAVVRSTSKKQDLSFR